MFVGCSEPLLGDTPPTSAYHGSDGFGDVPDPNAPDESNIQSEHAVSALLRISKENEGYFTQNTFLHLIFPGVIVFFPTVDAPSFRKGYN